MPDGAYMLKAACAEREKTMDERFARDKTAIETLEHNMATLSTLVTELATLQKTSAQTQAEHEKRIRALELQPAGKWDKLTGGIIGAIAGGLGTLILNTIIN